MPDLKLGSKMMIVFMLVTIIPIAVFGVYAIITGAEAAQAQSYKQLESVSKVKRGQVEALFRNWRLDATALVRTVRVLRQEAFQKLSVAQEVKMAQMVNLFSEARHDVLLLAGSQDVYQAFVKLRTYKEYYDDELGEYQETIDVTTEYFKKIFETISPYFDQFSTMRGYENIFIIDLEYGNVMYARHQREDLGANLRKGPLKDSGLGRLFRKIEASKDIAFEDFAPYSPADNQLAAFIGTIVKDAFGRDKAVVAIQLAPDPIQAITFRREGMGLTGETFLIARDGERIVLRSGVLNILDGASCGQDVTDRAAEYMHQALDGEQGKTIVTEKSGRTSVVVYSPLDVFGKKWAMLSVVLLEEAIAPKVTGDKEGYFHDHAARHGYNDLLLITPDGHVFFSVAHLADYGTNLIAGPYNTSAPGRLFRQVMETGQPGLADVAPYPAAMDEPVTFLAYPVVENGRIEVVVALQIPLAPINAVMHQDEGLGQSGDSYLVGQDGLRRSDSQLQPGAQSVKAAFSNPMREKIDTAATRMALAGKSGVIRIDYPSGRETLASFKPGQAWGPELGPGGRS